MFAMNGADFPSLPELDTDSGFFISGAVMRKMISKVLHSISEMDNRPMLKGAFFKLDGRHLEVVSCDSFTLSKCDIDCDIEYIGENGNRLSMIIPGNALSEMMRIIPDTDDKIRLLVTRKHVILHLDSIVFFARIIDSEYIDYNKIVPKEQTIFVTVDRERLLDGLERVNIIAEEKIQGRGRSYVKVTVDGEYLELSSSSVNGKVTDEIDCVHEGERLEIGFNCRFLINSVKVAEGDNIKITMKTPTQAITIENAQPDEDDKFSYLYMILPVRMNDRDN
jgi:DNA polymerase-3 subunit beta